MTLASTSRAAPHGRPLLEIENVTMRFGGLTAVNALSFEARKGEITALIGPNGAGKTTVFNCITGFYKPTVGRLTLRSMGGEFLLERMRGHEIGQKARVARTFQNIRLFPGMTVLENLMVAQHNKLMRASGWSLLGLLGAASFRRAEAAAVEAAFGLRLNQALIGEMSPAKALNTAAGEIEAIFAKSGRKTGKLAPLPE